MNIITLNAWRAGAVSPSPGVPCGMRALVVCKSRYRHELSGHRRASFAISFPGFTENSPWRSGNDRKQKRSPPVTKNDAPRLGTTTGGTTFGDRQQREVTALEKRSPTDTDLTLKQTGS
jgi:hypothetical protein